MLPAKQLAKELEAAEQEAREALKSFKMAKTIGQYMHWIDLFHQSAELAHRMAGLEK